MIHSHTIWDRSSALETRTTTCGQTLVLWRTKEPGGTSVVTNPTWTVVTWEAITRHTLTVLTGFTGLAITTRSNSRRWRLSLILSSHNPFIVNLWNVYHQYNKLAVSRTHRCWHRRLFSLSSALFMCIFILRCSNVLTTFRCYRRILYTVVALITALNRRSPAFTKLRWFYT